MSLVQVALAACAILFVLLIVWRLASIERRLAAMSRLEAKLDLLLRQRGVVDEPGARPPETRQAGVPDGVIEALRAGNKIEAIKHYREATGVGLAEAKGFVEEVERRTGLSR